jgi:DNA-binding transcriptional MocR family regulator
MLVSISLSLAQSGLEKKSHFYQNWTAMNSQELVPHLGVWPAGQGSLQHKLVRALAEAIRKGAVHPGIRLPSERSLAQALSISRTTVVAAYDALRESGWLESRTGSGTWVCENSLTVAAARGADHAGALAASPLLGLLAHRDDKDIIDFAMGCPLPLRELSLDLFTLPQDEYAALVHDQRYYPLGLPTARQAVATYYRKAGLPTRPEQVLITNGGQHAITLCAALYLQRGDSVLVEDPAYFGALDAFRVAGARIAPLPVEADGVSIGMLRDRIIATAARLVYLTPMFQNPTGAVMPIAARKAVARIASELAIPVIDDGVLAELALSGPTLPLIASYAPAAPILTIGSLSKSAWPGLRTGWVRAPEPIIERLARLKSANDLGSALLTQAITVRLLAAIDQIHLLRRRQLKPRRDLLAGLLRESLPDWKFRLPAGGLFLWVKLPVGDSREFAQVALRHGALILPGPTMSAAEQHASFFRLPFLAEDETLRAGVRRLSAAWRDYQRAGQSERRPNEVMV